MSFAPKHILVAVPCDGADAVELGDHLVDAACDVAKPYAARLTLLSVAPPVVAAYALGPDAPSTIAAQLVEAERLRAQNATRRLDQLAGRARARGVDAAVVVATDPGPVP